MGDHINLNRTYLIGGGSRNAERAVRKVLGEQFAVCSVRWERRGERAFMASVDFPDELARSVASVVPCMSAPDLPGWGYCVLLEAAAGAQVIRRRLLPIGSFDADSFGELAKEDCGDAVAADIDTFQICRPLDRLTLRFFISAAAELPGDRIWLITATGKERAQKVIQCREEGRTEIAVPPESQFETSDIGPRICSPTSVSMVLQAFGCNFSPVQAAAAAYLKECDLYGVWPANIYAAAQKGVLGLPVCFDSWESAAGVLRQGLPLVVSLRYGRGELTSAAQEREEEKPMGHLVVLRGFERDRVLVNDPAGRTRAEVARSYDLKEFLHVWLGRAALAYVFLPSAVLPEE